MSRLRAVVLFSGGKDSTFALHWAVYNGFNVVALASMIPRRKDSYMFHYPNISLVRFQAEAMELPIIVKETSGEKEREVEDLIGLLKEVKKNFNVNYVITGALASEYQRVRIARASEEVGLKVINPQWHKDPRNYMKFVVDLGIKFILTSVSAEGLDTSFLGKVVDDNLLRKILELSERYGFHPAFEGGEAETFVVDAPLFKKRIVIEEYEIIRDELSYEMLIKKISLKEK